MITYRYESECAVRNYDDGRGKWVTGPPSDWGHELFPDRMDRIEENLMAAMELIPSLGEVGITSCVNGPTIWTGDSLARVGRTHVENVFEMNTLTYGIAQSLPLADYLGGMILDGEPPFDATTDFDPLRYGSWCGVRFTEDKIKETYSHNNCVSYPFENRKAGREHVIATTTKKDEDGTVAHPMLPELQKAGAHNTFSNSGLEVPAFYFHDENDALRHELNESKMDHHDWIDRVRDEANAVLSGAAISYASFSKFRVSGTDSHALLSGATTAAIPKKVGRTKLTYVVFDFSLSLSIFHLTHTRTYRYACTPSGKVFAEFSVCKVAEDDYYLVGSRDYASHDAAWMASDRLRTDVFGTDRVADVNVENLSDDVHILHIAGPRSHEMLSSVCPEISDVPFLQMRPVNIAGHEVRCFRVSFTGCLGYELHCSAESVASVYRHLRSDPVTSEMSHFGSYAQNALRIEKGFKLRGDLDFAHYSEAGIDPFVKKKLDFVGKDPSYVPTRMSSVFKIQTGTGYEWSVPSDSPIRMGNAETGEGSSPIVGFTTGAALGGVTNSTISLGYVYTKDNGENTMAQPGDSLFVEAYGKCWPVELLEKPPVAVSGRSLDVPADIPSQAASS